MDLFDYILVFLGILGAVSTIIFLCTRLAYVIK